MLQRWQSPHKLTDIHLDPDDEAMGFTYWICGNPSARTELPDAWIQVEGGGFALEALHRYRALRRKPRTDIDVYNWVRMERRELRAYHALRRELAYAPEQEYRNARARAETIWSTAGIAERCGLAYTFPEQASSWGDEAANACAEHMRTHGGKMPNCAALLWASTSSLAALQKVLDARARTPSGNAYWEIDMGPYLYSMLDIHGLAAAPMIAELYLDVEPSWRKYHRAIVEAAHVVHARVMANAFARRLDDWIKRPTSELLYLDALPRPLARKAIRTALRLSKRNERVDRRARLLRYLSRNESRTKTPPRSPKAES